MNFSLEKSVYFPRRAKVPVGTVPPIDGPFARNRLIITHCLALLSLLCKNSWLMQLRRQGAINAA
ncbi:MAG: hypothetical protein PSV22_09500 [Pseudolabrys sp.]|nr:hypothetical protein [Pseudolabrys sp.]